ncbi:MAG TPA: peroxidase family protein [Vicinamibacterales bacterium]|nr:peroxidase family protein [Vicinamibacterales bacterium]
MPDPTLLNRVGDFLRDQREWYELPQLFAMVRLVEIRNELRAKNLIDTEEPPLPVGPAPKKLDPALRQYRTLDGTYDDLTCPPMGAAGRRFGRNVPLDQAFPDTANLLVPNPRVVSRELMTRDQFKPATILNLLAAAWIQFMVHDWFVHKRTPVDQGIEIPLAPGDDWSDPKMKVPRSVPEPAPAGSTRPPAYANPNSHWWDASQVYGDVRAVCDSLRTFSGGKLKLESSGLLPVDPATGVDRTGFTDNWWIGLAMLHTLFSREHNYLCDQLAAKHPAWTDDQLYESAKLINSAVLAKIHTIEWTPAILPNPITKLAMHVNWSGVVDDDLQQVFKFIGEDELLGGIVGSHAEQFGAPYSLTEEFVAVYRMHPLMPDEVVLVSNKTGAELERHELPDIAGRKARAIVERVSMADLFYSFGVTHPGAVTLHNYPRHLQNLTRDNGEHFDLAAVDILRDRERGVPRYNRFRQLLHKPPVKSFEELTDNPVWREQIRRVYDNDIEKVDLMTGLYAEPLPEGFGFSDTAFRIFILMASRRLKSDRFFTDDFRPEIYTEFGIDHIKQTTMLTVIGRHLPELAPKLKGLDNAFAPWSR